MIPRAVIVAGGLGTRAATLTGNRIPKALLPVAGMPIIFRQLEILHREGIRDITVLGGHLGDQLAVALEPQTAARGISLRVVIEQEALGTGGCLSLLSPSQQDCLIVYGDVLFDLSLEPLISFHAEHEPLLTVVCHPNDHPRTSDLIVVHDDLVRAVLPRRKGRTLDNRNLVPAAIYLASPRFFGQIQAGQKADMILDVLPQLLSRDAKIAAYNTPEYFRDVGTPARHAVAESDILAGKPESMNMHHQRSAVFFDCDGVLNEEPGPSGVLAPQEVKLIPGAGEAVRAVREAGLLAVAITNRPQVAKGQLTFDQLNHVLGTLEALLAESGGVLDRIYYCPHHPDRGFPGEVAALKIPCACRKPGTLLFEKAVAELPLRLHGSAVIGDSLRDIAAGRALGLWSYGVRTGHGCRDKLQYERLYGPAPEPHLLFDNVLTAARFHIQYRDIAAPVLRRLEPLLKCQRPIIVGVCGRSRAGKSVTAHALIRALEDRSIPSVHVPLDQWIVPAEDRGGAPGAESRNSVAILPMLIDAAKNGEVLRAPGYDAATRTSSREMSFITEGRKVVIFDGVFACHPTARHLQDLSVFVETDEASFRSRFEDFYRWKGYDAMMIEDAWRERKNEEWPLVDRQKHHVDVAIRRHEFDQ